jgi:hypothetical protein
MKQQNDEQVSLAMGDEERIEKALEALKSDPHAPRSLTVTVNLHVHQDYPKHVGDKIVANEAEEIAALEELEAKEEQSRLDAEKAEAPEKPAQPSNDPPSE